MKTNITAEEALKIAQKYKEKYKVPGIINSDINDSVKLYESFFNINGLTWLVISKLKDNCYEGSDDFTIVISDEKSEVEFILDNNGISQFPHMHIDSVMTDAEFKEIFGDD